MTTEETKQETNTDSQDLPGTFFDPQDGSKLPPKFNLPDELWMTVLASSCTFPPDSFSTVMLNLVKNPNVTSSRLFRADIFYDSERSQALPGGKGDLIDHLKAEYRPLGYNVPGFTCTRTIVRHLIPRNPQLDRPLVQTCRFYVKENKEEEQNLVIYLPHVTNASDLPFYHPSVRHLAFTHTWPSTPASPATISVCYALFPSTTLTSKLSRTALRLLETVHKHGQGQLSGYEKRVHLDQIIPQKRYQDTYARLKARYGRQLSEQWVEVTDPGKHVFEDIAIAAYLIELWADMYATKHAVGQESEHDKTAFQGFVDIGCGNGVLVYILLAEGYNGWGFDARERKTWQIFPEHMQQMLHLRLLVPSPLECKGDEGTLWHNGTFKPGTFIISNHADELTAWTPLLAYLNDSAFIAIPCCSHDLAGSRFRAPPTAKAWPEENRAVRLPQQSSASETGSLKRTEVHKKMPSAYATLCSYVESLAEVLGFEPEKDVLRIPSTRNHCIVGRHRQRAEVNNESGDREREVATLVERELGRNISAVGKEWVERAEKLAEKPGSGH